MINQNQKISYLSEVLTPLNRTFFSVQSLFLSVGQAFPKLSFGAINVFLDLKQHVNDD